MTTNTNSAQERTASIDLAQLDDICQSWKTGVISGQSAMIDISGLVEVARRSLTSDHRETTSGAPAGLSYADAEQWARDNGLKVPDAWLVGAAAKTEQVDMLRDMLAIQEVCGLHTDEYAPGSVIEHIKELEADSAAGAGSTQGEWQIVPVKLTKEMQRIAVKARGNRNTPVEEIWSQILSAAPRAAIAPSRYPGQEEASTQTVPDGAAGTVEKEAALIRDALDIAHDLAVAEANHVHELYKGYKPHRHEAVDRDVDTIKRAIAAIEAHNKAGKEQG